MSLRAAALALGAALLAACASGTRPYPDDLAAHNLAIRTASSARASLHVHSVDGQCRTAYLGSLALDKPVVSAGVPPGRRSYLEFSFATSSFLGGRSTHASRATLLDPRPGASYDIEVTYRDDIYNVVVNEKLARGAARELPLVDFGACRPG